MKFIVAPLVILILISIFVQLYNFQPLIMSGGYMGSTNVNGLSDSQLGSTNTLFTITALVGFIGLFTAVAIIGILSGLNISVFGSTVKIDGRSQKIIYNALFYGGLWGIFSTLATLGINGLGLFSIPVFGVIFYICLTLFYVFGINSQIEGSGTNE